MLKIESNNSTTTFSLVFRILVRFNWTAENRT